MSMPTQTEIPSHQIREAIENLAESVTEKRGDREDLVIVGIANGGINLGIHLARLIEEKLEKSIPSGIVDITFHRDDIGLQPISKISLPTELPFSIDDAHVILVDDVLFTGRTVRAAINELFDQGRPEAIELLVLYHRLDTRLPIQPDYCAFKNKIPPDRRVHLELEPDTIDSASLKIT